jgi:hypothetical protein
MDEKIQVCGKRADTFRGGVTTIAVSVALLASTIMDTLFNSSLLLLLSLCLDSSKNSLTDTSSSLLPADCFRDGESS